MAKIIKMEGMMANKKSEEKKILSKGLSKIAISKSAKINQAQQYMLIAVLGAGLFLGFAAALVMHFVGQISYNAEVISKEDASIAAYSDTIKNVGICQAPDGKTYSDKELNNCDPNSVDVSLVPGTLRSDILQSLAANEALNSVPKEDSSSCINPETKKNFTYSELNDIYNSATTTDELVAATELIQSCSALRVIPDALPSSRNDEALLSSLNKIFDISGWEPELISPAGEYDVASFDPNLKTISVQLSVETSFGTTMTFLRNVERSIREFNIKNASIEWSSENSVTFDAKADAFYVDKSVLQEEQITIQSGNQGGGEQ